MMRLLFANQFRSSLLRQRTALAGLSIATTASLSASIRVSKLQQANKIPPRFGRSITTTTSSLSDSIPNSDEREDCPICKRYSQGPCGDIFKQWLACSDAHPGKDERTGEDLHLSKCLHLAKELGPCLEKHEEYYESLNIYEPEEGEQAESTEELQKAWQKVIEEIEQSRESKRFPSTVKPIVEINPKQRAGFVALSLQLRQSQSIIMTYVRCDASGEVLAAGSNEDLWEWRDGLGILRLSLNTTTKSVTVFALYEDGDADDVDGDVLMAHTVMLPK